MKYRADNTDLDPQFSDAELELISKPRKLTKISVIIATILVVVFVVVGVLLKKSEAGVVFTTGDQVGIAGIGFILAFGSLLFTWPRVWANSERVRVRNIFSTKNVPWGVVRGVGVTSGAAWAVLDLHDDDQVAMLGLQVGDGEYALAAMKRLRQLHQQATGPAKATGDNP